MFAQDGTSLNENIIPVLMNQGLVSIKYFMQQDILYVIVFKNNVINNVSYKNILGFPLAHIFLIVVNTDIMLHAVLNNVCTQYFTIFEK